MGDDGKKQKFIPGQVLIKEDNGDITVKDGGLMIHNEREPIPFLEVQRQITTEEPVTTRLFPEHLANAPSHPSSLFEQIMTAAASQTEAEEQELPLRIASINNFGGQPQSFKTHSKQRPKPAMIVLPSEDEKSQQLRISAYDEEKGNNIHTGSQQEHSIPARPIHSAWFRGNACGQARIRA